MDFDVRGQQWMDFYILASLKLKRRNDGFVVSKHSFLIHKPSNIKIGK